MIDFNDDKAIAAELALGERATTGPVMKSSRSTTFFLADLISVLATVQRFQDDGEFIVATYNNYPAALRYIQDGRKPVKVSKYFSAGYFGYARHDDCLQFCYVDVEGQFPSFCPRCGKPLDWSI